MVKSKIIFIVLILGYIFAIIFPLQFALGQGSKADSIVPISDMTLQNHLLFFNVILPNLLTPIFIIVFPLIFVPLFLLLKGKIWYRYENTYIDLSEDALIDIKLLVKRFIYLFLLIMGLSATFLNTGLIRVSDFLSGEQQIYWVEQQGIKNPLYITDIFTNIASIVLPLAVGLWAIGWALEDCGLMHYNLPETEEKMLYEIEPVFRKYQNTIKGYAGISAILFFTSAVAYYVVYVSGDILSLLSLVFGSILIVFIAVFQKLY